MRPRPKRADVDKALSQLETLFSPLRQEARKFTLRNDSEPAPARHVRFPRTRRSP